MGEEPSPREHSAPLDRERVPTWPALIALVMRRWEARMQAGVLLALAAALAYALFVRTPPAGRNGALLTAAVALLAGTAGWVCLEYPLHRYVLHNRPPPWASARMRSVLDGLHARHHREPHDPRFVFFGPVGLVVFLSAIALPALALGGPVASLGAALGLGLLMFNYQVMHVATHTEYRARTRWFASMKRAHLAHHASRRAGCYALTTPLLDLLFGTWHPDRASDATEAA